MLANQFYNSTKVQKKLNDVSNKFDEKMDEDLKYSREESLNNLRYIISRCKNEIDRIETAHDEEINSLLENEELTNKEIIELVTNLRKRRRLGKVPVDGILGATSILNKMYGYNDLSSDLDVKVSFVENEFED